MIQVNENLKNILSDVIKDYVAKKTSEINTKVKYDNYSEAQRKLNEVKELCRFLDKLSVDSLNNYFTENPK